LEVRLKLYSPTPGAPQHARGVCFRNPEREKTQENHQRKNTAGPLKVACTWLKKPKQRSSGMHGGLGLGPKPLSTHTVIAVD
jgi:hypothetical protein